MVLHVSKKYEEDFCSSEKMHETFSDYREHTSLIFKSLKVLMLKDIIQFSIWKLYFYFNDQLPLQVKSIFIKNESVNPYDNRGGKLLFIPHINANHFGTNH